MRTVQTPRAFRDIRDSSSLNDYLKNFSGEKIQLRAPSSAFGKQSVIMFARQTLPPTEIELLNGNNLPKRFYIIQVYKTRSAHSNKTRISFDEKVEIIQPYKLEEDDPVKMTFLGLSKETGCWPLAKPIVLGPPLVASDTKNLGEKHHKFVTLIEEYEQIFLGIQSEKILDIVLIAEDLLPGIFEVLYKHEKYEPKKHPQREAYHRLLVWERQHR